MDWFFEHLAAYVFTFGVGSLFGFGRGLWKKFGSQQIWRMRDPKNLVVCISLSAISDTGKYKRFATGVGQVRALGVIAPALARAYRRVNLQKILFPNQLAEHDKAADLIVLGGPITNELTKEIFAKWGESVPVRFEVNRLVVGTGPEEFSQDATEARGDVRKDVGLIVWTKNPFDRSKRLILLAGSHTYGTTAAAMFLTDHYARPRRLPDEGFIETVVCVVRNGEVEEPRSVDWRSIVPHTKVGHA